MASMYTVETLLENTRVVIDTKRKLLCRVWLGPSFYKFGYGRVYKPGHWDQARRRGKYTGVHRLMVELHDDVHLTPQQHVLHRCDNPPCIRRNHLVVADHAANMSDMAHKDRGRSGGSMRQGTAHPLHKLKDEDIQVIRATYAAGGVTQRELAARFGITQPSVSMIVNRIHWNHL